MADALGAQLAGLAIGLVHALLLGSVGLYAESEPLTIVRSALRYATFGMLVATAMGLLARLVLDLSGGRFRAMVLPLPALVVAAYLAGWAVFFGSQSGESGVHLLMVALALGAGSVLAVLGGRRLAFREAGGMRPWAVAGFVVAGVMVLFVGEPREAMRPASFPSAIEQARPAAVAPFAPGRWNVLLLTYDTLRADHLGSYGYERARTEDFDTLARTGVQFDNAIVQRPKTSPNVATFLTGTYPAWHGIHTPMRRLPDRVETLAEVLAAEGWMTGAVITNGNLFPEFGFDQGYGEYLYGHSGARESADLALDWLERHATRGEPWHLWVHATDPHWPYEPPPEWEEQFVRPGMGEAELQVARYDGEIAFASEQTGRILDWLDAHPEVRATTLVVLTADHGESLGEHDYSYEHGMHPYEPSARVPLVFSMPGRIPQGERRSPVVGSVDLVPTILDVVDVAVPDVVQGHSILPLVQGITDVGPQDFVYLEAGYGEHIGPGRTRALRTGTTKYVRRLKQWALFPDLESLPWTFDAAIEGGLSPDEYYDLVADPGETQSLPTDAAAERDRLAAFAGWLMAEVEAASSEGALDLDPETEASLRSLGYIE
jgi:arylsulfatase A-like enzyme